MAEVAHLWTSTSALLPEAKVLTFKSVSEVESHLARLEEYGRQLRSARNSMLPVAQLPVKLLSQVFSYLLSRPEGPLSEPSTRQLRYATYVSRHWRTVALDCSTLWTWVEVVDVHPNWTAEMLRRSKRSTISFTARLNSPKLLALEASRLVLAHMDRIGEIRIFGDRRTIPGLLSQMTSYAPRLEALFVEISHRNADGNIVRLSGSLLQGGAPRLSHLVLVQCAVPWDAPFLRSCPDIHTLCIDGGEYAASSPSQLLEVFKSMPRLRTVGNIVCTAHPEKLRNQDLVYLPKLDHITLGGSAQGVASLLAHLSFPPSTSITIQCVCTDKPNELSHSVVALSHSLGLISGAPIHSFHISCDAMHVSICANPASQLEGTNALWRKSEPGTISLCLIANPTADPHTSATLTALTNAFALQDVASLALDDAEGMLDRATALALLQRMPNLTRLHIRHDTAAHVVSALGGRGGRIPVPRLETLVVEESDMGASPGLRPLIDALERVQLVRSDYRPERSIEGLRIRRCRNFRFEDCILANGLYSHVEWDVIEGYVPDNSEWDDWSGKLTYSDWLEFRDLGVHWCPT